MEDGVTIYQFDTGETYTVQPTEEEIAKAKEEAKELGLEGEAAEGFIRLVATPQEVPFRYAPSNLALDEISAYEFQIELHNEGLLPLNEEDFENSTKED